MNFYKTICNELSELVPENRKEKLSGTLKYAGIESEFDFYMGRALLLSLLFMTIGFLLPITLLKDYVFSSLRFEIAIASCLAVSMMFFIIAGTLQYLYIFYKVENRKTRAEAVFPDFLLLVASNLRAGTTPYSALKASARPEFSPLSEEIKTAASKALGTESFTDALKEASTKIKSRVINETISFFAIAMKSGGHLAKMLEESAATIRQTQELKKEISAATKMYVIFVIFIMVFAAPLLFALSGKFVDMVSTIKKMGGDKDNLIVKTEQGKEISASFVFILSSAMLLINSLLGAMFIGVIQKGKAKLGLKYFPAIFLASYAVFIISGTIISATIKIGA